MILYSLTGAILFECTAPTIKTTLEIAVQENIDLSHVNLRRAKLRGAKLDGLHAPQGCFWGADLTRTDMADAVLNHADFRLATLIDTCLADSICKQGDFSGAYFRGTLINETDFTAARFSCPSFLTLPLDHAASFDKALYWHQGEHPCDLSGGIARFSLPPHECLILGEHLIHNGRLIT